MKRDLWLQHDVTPKGANLLLHHSTCQCGEGAFTAEPGYFDSFPVAPPIPVMETVEERAPEDFDG